MIEKEKGAGGEDMDPIQPASQLGFPIIPCLYPFGSFDLEKQASPYLLTSITVFAQETAQLPSTEPLQTSSQGDSDSAFPFLLVLGILKGVLENPFCIWK